MSLPFPWLGRCLSATYGANTLTVRVLLQQGLGALSSSLIDALPAPVRAHVEVNGQLLAIGTPRERSWDKENTLKGLVEKSYRTSAAPAAGAIKTSAAAPTSSSSSSAPSQRRVPTFER